MSVLTRKVKTWTITSLIIVNISGLFSIPVKADEPNAAIENTTLDISSVVFSDSLHIKQLIDNNEHYKNYMINLGNKVKELDLSNDASIAAELISKELNLDTKSEMEKIINIHDYIAYNTSYKAYKKVYSESNELIGWNTYSQSINNVLSNGYAVCEGYALLFKYLLDYNGVYNEYIIGMANGGTEIEKHAWNAVCIDNEWFNIDITWDASRIGSYADIKYKYFLLSDESFWYNGSHLGEAGKIHECTSDKYRDMVTLMWLGKILDTSDYIQCNFDRQSIDTAVVMGLTALSSRALSGNIDGKSTDMFYIIMDRGNQSAMTASDFTAFILDIIQSKYNVSVTTELANNYVVYKVNVLTDNCENGQAVG